MSMPNTLHPGSYPAFSRFLHWLMAVLVVLQIASGFLMTYKGPEGNVWSRVSDALYVYDSHKLLGLVLLGLILVRIANRVLRGAPPDEPTLTQTQREVAGFVHYGLYGLLVLVPLIGWLGISLYPALNLYNGAVVVPSIAAPHQSASEGVFIVHYLGGLLLAGLILLHVGAALYHHFVRRDGVLGRMAPNLGRRS